MKVHRRPSIRVVLTSFLALVLFLGGGPSGLAAQETVGLPLWEATRDGRTVHLMGSVHLLRPDAYPLDEALYEAFDAADVVLFELDLGELATAGPTMMTRGMYADGRTLRDMLPGDLFTELEARAATVGLAAPMIERLKPWMAAMTLTSLMLQQAGYEATSGIDFHFHERAQAADKRVVGLETVTEQIEAFEALGDDGQLALLRSTLDQWDETVAQLDDATEYWRHGDAERLAEMMTEAWGDHPMLIERLLYDRNQNWMPQIEALFDEPGAAIVIVGMAHLVGEGSVVELLQQRGFEVERLSRQLAAAEPTR